MILDTGFRSRTKSTRSPVQLLGSVHSDATILSLRLAIAARGQRHKDVIVDRIGGDAVGVAVGGNVLQPLPLPSVDYAQHRAGEHVSRREVIFVIARVVPALVHAADEVDRGDDGAGGAVDDVCERGELPAVVARAGD